LIEAAQVHASDHVNGVAAVCCQLPLMYRCMCGEGINQAVSGLLSVQLA